MDRWDERTRMGSLSRASLCRERVWTVYCHLITSCDQGLVNITALLLLLQWLFTHSFAIFNFTVTFQKNKCSCHKKTGWFLWDRNLLCTGFHIKWNFRGAWPPLPASQRVWQQFTFKFSLLSPIFLAMKCIIVMKSLHFSDLSSCLLEVHIQ